MNFRNLKVFFIVVFCLFKSLVSMADSIALDEIQPMIIDYMNEYNVPGAEVIIQANGQSYQYSFGYTDVDKTTPITHQTLFELGSITKTFVGLLLSEQVLNGNIKLNDSLSLYISKDYSKDIKKITPLELATHTSGLPYFVSNLPYNAKATSEHKTAYTYFLQNWSSKYARGTQFLYSNIGFSLLAKTLADHAHLPLFTLMQANVFKPLEMNSSMLGVTKAWNQLYAQGYTSNDSPTRAPSEGYWEALGQ